MTKPTLAHGVMPELLPCPFCDGEASASGVIRYHDKHEAWFSDGTRVTQAFYCNCVSCGISNKGLVGHQTRTKAIAAWNRRAAIQQAAGAVPEGWKLVPLEPTPAMLEASLRAFEWGWTEPCPELLECGVPVESGITQEEADQINADAMKEHAMMYRAFLAASPSPLGREAGKEGSSDHLAACAGDRVQVPLTDDELCDIAEDFKSQYVHGGTTFDEFDFVGFGRAIQSTHGIVEPAPRPDAPTSQINPDSAPREDGHGRS